MKVQKEYRVREYQQKNKNKTKCNPLDPVKLPILLIKAQKQNSKNDLHWNTYIYFRQNNLEIWYGEYAEKTELVKLQIDLTWRHHQEVNAIESAVYIAILTGTNTWTLEENNI